MENFGDLDYSMFEAPKESWEYDEAHPDILAPATSGPGEFAPSLNLDQPPDTSVSEADFGNGQPMEDQREADDYGSLFGEEDQAGTQNDAEQYPAPVERGGEDVSPRDNGIDAEGGERYLAISFHEDDEPSTRQFSEAVNAPRGEEDLGPRDYQFDTDGAEPRQEGEENDQHTSNPKWDDSIADFDQARAWLLSASGEIMHVSLPHDDVATERQRPLHHTKRLFGDLLCVQSGSKAHWTDEEKGYFTSYQNTGMDCVVELLSTDNGAKRAQSHCLLLVEAAISLHDGRGVLEAPIMWKIDSQLKFSERITHMVDCLRIKRVAEKVIIGEPNVMSTLVLNPKDLFTTRENAGKSNANKRQKNEAGAEALGKRKNGSEAKDKKSTEPRRKTSRRAGLSNFGDVTGSTQTSTAAPGSAVSTPTAANSSGGRGAPRKRAREIAEDLPQPATNAPPAKRQASKATNNARASGDFETHEYGTAAPSIYTQNVNLTPAVQQNIATNLYPPTHVSSSQYPPPPQPWIPSHPPQGVAPSFPPSQMAPSIPPQGTASFYPQPPTPLYPLQQKVAAQPSPQVPPHLQNIQTPEQFKQLVNFYYQQNLAQMNASNSLTPVQNNAPPAGMYTIQNSHGAGPAMGTSFGAANQEGEQASVGRDLQESGEEVL